VARAEGIVPIGRQDLGDAEIQELRDATLCDEDVARLEVPVDDEALMRELNRFADLAEETQTFFHPELSATAIEVDGGALDVLRNQVRQAVLGRAPVQDPSDVRMLQVGEDLSFAPEAADDLFGVQPTFENLDGDPLLELAVSARPEVDASHPAYADLPNDPVPIDDPPFQGSLGSDLMQVEGRNLQERSFFAVEGEQGFHVAAQLRLPAARLVQEASPVLGITVQGRFQEFFDLLPVLRSHGVVMRPRERRSSRHRRDSISRFLREETYRSGSIRCNPHRGHRPRRAFGARGGARAGPSATLASPSREPLLRSLRSLPW
jgi:hypothetical protein